MNCSTPGLPVQHQLPEFTQTHSIKSVMPSSYLILCRPLLLLPPIPPSIRVFSNESTLRMRWPKYWSFSISPSSEYSGLTSFRMDWLDLLAVQGILKSLLQHQSSILRRSAFFTVQLSHPYMTTGKTIALTRQTFVGKVMSLLFAWGEILVYHLLLMVTLDKLLNLYNPQFFGRVGHATWFVRSCCCSVAKSCLTPCDPMDCSMPGFPVQSTP